MKYLLPFVIFLLFGFYGDSWSCHAQTFMPPSPVAAAPIYQSAVPVYQAPCIGCVVPQIYLPQVQYVPYQYQGSQVVERQFATPIRNALFGRYRAYHYYAPQVQQ